jgi:hypothetical protein
MDQTLLLLIVGAVGIAAGVALPKASALWHKDEPAALARLMQSLNRRYLAALAAEAHDAAVAQATAQANLAQHSALVKALQDSQQQPGG